MKNNRSEQEIRIVVNNSFSYAQAMRGLDIIPIGGNYKTFKRMLKKFNINTQHFTGKLWSKGKTLGIKYSIEDYLSGRRVVTKSHDFKLRLIKSGIFERKCYNCNGIEWMGEPIPIELHHKNGNTENNTIENLTILCPNCHALTDNYRIKNHK